METFKPFLLPPLFNEHGPAQLMSNDTELREVLRMLNPLYLAAAKKYLPWYLKVFDGGDKIKIKVFKPEIVFK